MAEVNQYIFTYKEIVEALIKKQGLHEGVWRIYLEFGIAGANAGPTEDQILPAAIVPINKMGLARVPKEDVLSVDAARVNPALPKTDKS
jgi:hypothetical protein